MRARTHPRVPVLAALALAAILGLGACSSGDEPAEAAVVRTPTKAPATTGDSGSEDPAGGASLTLAETWAARGDAVVEQGASSTWECPTPDEEVRDSLAGLRVWGDEIYTLDSAVCVAGVHQGLIDLAEGGTLEVTWLAGQASYQGSERHGIVTQDYGPWSGSFTLTVAEY